MMLFVIEHLEPELSEWLFIEYSHASRIVAPNPLLITNVRDPAAAEKLRRIALVEGRRAHEIFDQRGLVVLDPRAKRRISPSDLRGKEAIVIGGILGEDPPIGRTRELLVKTLPRAITRNLGRHRFAIDGAAYAARQALEGKGLEQIPVKLGLEIKHDDVRSTLLPYAYPLVKGEPLISPELTAYLRRAPWPQVARSA